MSEHTALTAQQDPIYQMLSKYKGAIASVIPKHMTAEKMLRVAYQMIYRTPKLKSCTQASLINGIMEISLLGLDIGRTAHLIPFKNEAVVIVDYKGFIELAHRSGQINSFPFNPVYENDLFEYEEGTARYIKHRPAPKNRGSLIAAYAIVNFKHGGFDFVVVHPADIEAVKKVAPGAKSSDSPWNKPDQEYTMWCKTAVRRLAKRIPQSPELRRVTELEDLVEAGLSQGIGHLADDMLPVAETKPEELEPETGNPHEAIKKKLEETKGQTETSTNHDDPDSFEKLVDWHKEAYPECDFEPTTKRGLKKHITQSHPDPEPEIDNDPKLPPKGDENGTVWIQCPKYNCRKTIQFCEKLCDGEIKEKCEPYNDKVKEIGADGKKIECPNLDGQAAVSVQYCAKSCHMREGCPAWE